MLDCFRTRTAKALAVTLCGAALLSVAGCGGTGSEFPALKLTAPAEDNR